MNVRPKSSLYVPGSWQERDTTLKLGNWAEFHERTIYKAVGRAKRARGESDSWTCWESCIKRTLWQELAFERQTHVIWVAGREELKQERLWPHKSLAFCCPAGASDWLNPTGSLQQSPQASFPGKRSGWKRIWRANWRDQAKHTVFCILRAVVFGEGPCY